MDVNGEPNSPSTKAEWDTPQLTSSTCKSRGRDTSAGVLSSRVRPVPSCPDTPWPQAKQLKLHVGAE